MSSRINIFSIILSFTLVVWLEMFISVEWTSAYCSNPEDGQLSALYGFPFPYTRWGMVSSVEHIFAPLKFSIVDTDYESYMGLRPIGFTNERWKHKCTPSPYWFPYASKGGFK